LEGAEVRVLEVRGQEVIVNGSRATARATSKETDLYWSDTRGLIEDTLRIREGLPVWKEEDVQRETLQKSPALCWVSGEVDDTVSIASNATSEVVRDERESNQCHRETFVRIEVFKETMKKEVANRMAVEVTTKDT
jgi:hypothetical protein